MAYTEILSSHALTVDQWNRMIFQEYIGNLWWRHLMGTTSNDVIQIKEDLSKSPGDTIIFGLRGQMVGGKVTGRNRGIDNAGRVDFYSDNLTVDNVRFVIRIDDVPMTQQRVTFDVLMHAKEALVEKAQLDTDDTITSTLNGDNSTGRVQGRYLYGALDSNYNATHATALATIDATNDKLTTKMIDIAKRKALIPVNATAKIRPARVKMGKSYEEWFFGCFHTYPIRDMVNDDAAWRNAQLNIPPRADASSVIYTGTSYKGAWNGTMIYEYDRLPLVTNSNSVQCAKGFLLGAQSLGIAWAQRSKFAEQPDDFGHEMNYQTHEIRGLKKFVFDRNSIDGSTNENQGFVEIFSAAVAD